MVKSLEDLRLSVSTSPILTNPLFLLSIFIISMGFILYVFISYFVKQDKKQYKTYLNKDLTDNDYLFDSDDNVDQTIDENPTLEQCEELCKLNTKCDGMTYNEEYQRCILTEDGLFRDGNDYHYAWKKPSEDKDVITAKTNVLDYTNKLINVSRYKFPEPRFSGAFCYSFWINITDWYTDNYGYWKHIFHKGTYMNQNNTKIYERWEDVVRGIPEQMVGVWLAPYHNNLRICYNIEEEDSGEEYNTQDNRNYTETKCYTNPNTNIARCYKDITTPEREEPPTYLNGNYIELYEGKYYRGKKTKIYIRNEDVNQISNNKKVLFSYNNLLRRGYRRERLSSIKVPYGTKIRLLSDIDLASDLSDAPTEENQDNVVIDKNIPDLSKINFDNKMNKFILEEYQKNENIEKKIAYYDIQNIDINIPTHITLNFNQTYLDIYVNGKLRETQNLNSLKNEERRKLNRKYKLNYGNLYAKYPSSFKGSIYNLGYIPEYISKENIQKIFDQKPNFKYDKQLGVQTLLMENFTSSMVNNVKQTDLEIYDN